MESIQLQGDTVGAVHYNTSDGPDQRYAHVGCPSAMGHYALPGTNTLACSSPITETGDCNAELHTWALEWSVSRVNGQPSMKLEWLVDEYIVLTVSQEDPDSWCVTAYFGASALGAWWKMRPMLHADVVLLCGVFDNVVPQSRQLSLASRSFEKTRPTIDCSCKAAVRVGRNWLAPKLEAESSHRLCRN
jgi:hypothetical protein